MRLLVLLDERLTMCLFYLRTSNYVFTYSTHGLSNLCAGLQTHLRTFVQTCSTCKYLTMYLLIPLLCSLTDLHYLCQILPQTYSICWECLTLGSLYKSNASFETQSRSLFHEKSNNRSTFNFMLRRYDTNVHDASDLRESMIEKRLNVVCTRGDSTKGI